MRIVAAVLDTESIDSPLPGPTQALVRLSSLRDRLPVPRPRELGSLRDAWGNPLLYWSGENSYLILSFGSDGRPQFDYSAIPPYLLIGRAWAGSDPTEDLMIVDG